MRDRPAADRTAKLLLWFLREPLRFRAEIRRADAAPLDSEAVLRLALGREVDFDDPALRRASSAALREAAAAYVRQVFFRRDASPYQTLGLAPGASEQAIKEHFRLLMQLVHPDRQNAEGLWPDAFAARTNRAYATLRNPKSRAKLDREEDERAAGMRAAQQRSAAAAMTPAARWPRPGYAARRPPPRAVLPEWLTAGFGGFVRQHPAVMAFAALLGGAALVIVAATWERQPGSLTREARGPSVPTSPAPARDAPEPVATAAEAPARVDPPVTVAGAPGPAAASPAAVAASTSAPERVAAPTRHVGAPDPRRVAQDRDLAEAPRAFATVAGANPPDPAPPVATASTPLLGVANPVAARAEVPALRTEATGPAAAPPVPSAPPPLTTAEIDALSAAFVDSYDRGGVDAFAALFDDDAETNLHHGRAAIRGEYGELFRLSEWRRMQWKQIYWRRAGDRAYGKGEITILIGWRDGREVEQRVAVDIDVVRRDGRVVITRLAHQPSAP